MTKFYRDMFGKLDYMRDKNSQMKLGYFKFKNYLADLIPII